MDITNRVLIFSGEKSSVDGKTNAKRTSEVERALRLASIDYKKVVGSYKGSKENSFVVLDTDKTRGVVQDLCEIYNQESYLAIDANRASSLVYLSSGRTEELGRFKSTNEEQAKSCESYNFDPTTGIYYTT